MEVTFFRSPPELRQWLEENHDKAAELWVGFRKKSSGEEGLSYAQVLDEAICFGWIDGTRKSLGESSYTIRFSPRKPGSIWSVVNIKRAGELSELGLMQPPGLKAFTERDQKKQNQYSYEQNNHELSEDYERQLRANNRAWDFFQAQAPSYRKAANWWVASAKREETRQKRLAALIEVSEQGRRLPHLVSPSRK
jgi:uncharacterized protein YdeI (YjbR/CyaY-like superfamily)